MFLFTEGKSPNFVWILHHHQLCFLLFVRRRRRPLFLTPFYCLVLGFFFLLFPSKLESAAKQTLLFLAVFTVKPDYSRCVTREAERALNKHIGENERGGVEGGAGVRVRVI